MVGYVQLAHNWAGVGGDRTGELRFLESRPMGGAWVLDQLWRLLGVGDALRRVAAGRRVTPLVERLIFALVANRALAPMSKLARVGVGTRRQVVARGSGSSAAIRRSSTGQWNSCWSATNRSSARCSSRSRTRRTIRSVSRPASPRPASAEIPTDMLPQRG